MVRGVVGAIGGVVLLGALVAAPVAAGNLEIKLTNVELGFSCFVATPTGEGSDINLELRDSENVLKSNATISSPSPFPTEVCFDAPILGGDHIVVAGGEDQALPRLRIRSIDRNGDKVVIRGTPGLTAELRTHRCSLGQGFNIDVCPQRTTQSITLDANGQRTIDLTSKIDLRSHDLVQVRHTLGPDELMRVSAPVPGLFIEVGSSSLDGVLPNGVTGSYQLRAKDGTIRASAQLVGTTDTQDTTWRKNGGAVSAKAGNRVTGNVPGGLSIVLPKGPTTINAATDVVAGTCFKGGKVMLEQIVFEDVILTAKADGTFSVDLTSRGGFESGAGLELQCVTKAFDLVRYQKAAP
jgi:hypothetical protein